jgi:hypothetical protein
MKNIIFIAFTGLMMASCNDNSAKTAPLAEPTAVVQSPDTSRSSKPIVALNKAIVKKGTVKQTVRTKKVRSVQKVAKSKKTSDTKNIKH